ncbi:MAG: helix-turn-helix domain-containing protein, partial [Candidatus Dadabacteria bacterium]
MMNLMKKATTDPLLTSSEAATLLDCHESTIKRFCDSGLLSFQRTPGGHRRIPLDSLLAFARESGQPLTLPLLDMGEHAATFWHAWQAFRASETTLLVDLMEQWLLSHALDLIAPTMRLLAQQEQIELADVFDDLIQPLMARIGDRWAAGRLTVAQEHLYSHVIEQGLFILAEARRRLGAAYESVVRKRALVACAEG